MKNYIKVLMLLVVFGMTACQDIVDGINENPNDIIVEDIDIDLFLTGTMIANSVAQAGHMSRIAGMYSGQLIGITSLYSNIYGFSLSTAEANSTWNAIYVGCIANLRHIRTNATNDKLLTGIAKVIEAHAIGTAASIFGNVPYSEVSNPDIDDPVFDDQISVFNDAIELLKSGISDLNGATSRPLSVDIYFEGDADKWVAAANTLKARYHLHMRDYSDAYDAAQQGISDPDGSMKYIPRGDVNIATGDKNLFWTILEGSRAGDIGTKNSYLIQLIDPANADGRNNAKTDETARAGYYNIKENGGALNDGIIEQFEPQNLVTYAENQLILAECGARTSGFGTGLGHLNDLRAWLNTGGMVNDNYSGMPLKYDAYVAADFASGGMENADGIDDTRALLREIIEERYVSGFGMYMPYDDARRLRKGDTDIAVPFVMVDGPAPPYPERMPYADDELNANENAPSEDPGIFVKTPVNQ